VVITCVEQVAFAELLNNGDRSIRYRINGVRWFDTLPTSSGYLLNLTTYSGTLTTNSYYPPRILFFLPRFRFGYGFGEESGKFLP
jgi:hypothetical protein